MKTFLTIFGSVLIIASSVQFAAAAQRPHHYKSDRVVVRQQPCPCNSYAAWPATSPELYDYPPSVFTGGWSAPAGR